jgi:hypothetical protein
MSTDFCLLNRVRASDLFDGRLTNFGIREHIVPDATTASNRCLTDGNNFVWVYVDDDGFVTSITRYFPGGAPGKILGAVAKAFDVDIVSEYEPEFWGYETQEEWDAAMEKMARESKDRFCIEILKFAQGDPNDIGAGTVGMIQATIAKTLIENDASLLLATNKERLINEMNAIYDRDHAVTVTMGPEDRALAQMIATHEDDLPQA